MRIHWQKQNKTDVWGCEYDVSKRFWIEFQRVPLKFHKISNPYIERYDFVESCQFLKVLIRPESDTHFSKSVMADEDYA